VERDGEFDDTEIWTDVAAVFSGSRDNLVANFLGQPRELVEGEFFNVGRAVDGFEQAWLVGRRDRG
jgi:hypothetical protein